MNFSLRRRRMLDWVAAPLMLALVGGCANMGSAGANDETLLLQRSQAYWGALRTNDGISAWSYEDVSKDPGWTLQNYLQRGGVTYDAVEVRGIKKVEGDHATMDVVVHYSVPLLRMKKQKAELQDEWRRIDGQWFHVLNKGSLFKGS